MNLNYESPFGALVLKRFPYLPQSKSEQNLQAWDGADTLLLEELKAHPVQVSQRMLILNDQFGALSIALQQFNPDIQSDSFVSRSAIERNLHESAAPDVQAVRFFPSTERLTERYDVVLIRIPKSLHFLEHQLHQLRSVVHEGTRVIATAMAKNLSPKVRELFSHVLGPSEQSLAKRKARLIHCAPAPDKWAFNERHDRCFEVNGKHFLTLANVFSNGRVDPGTRVFLDHLDQLPKSASVLDLACGSGVMGVLSALQCEANQLYLCDESYMAVESAERNAQAHCPNIESHGVVAHSIPDSVAQVDLVVNNPPFHQQQTKTSEIALQMFRDAKRHLKIGGQLWVVANRHLDYHRSLKKLFGNCHNQGKHPKYVLLQCTKLAR